MNQPQYLSPAGLGGGRGMLLPEQLFILVTQLKKLLLLLLFTNWWSESVKGLLSAGPTLSSCRRSVATPGLLIIVNIYNFSFTVSTPAPLTRYALKFNYI